MNLIIIMLYFFVFIFYYLFILNKYLEDRKIFVNYSEESIVAIKSLYGWYFISRNKNIFLKNKVSALFYLLFRGYIPK